MGEKFTSRVGFLIRNFRIAAEMTQRELADKCGLNESTIRNYELGNRYPDEATLLNIANNLGVSFYALSDPDVANILRHSMFCLTSNGHTDCAPLSKMVKYVSNLKNGFQVPVPARRKTLIASRRWLSTGHACEISWRMVK